MSNRYREQGLYVDLCRTCPSANQVFWGNWKQLENRKGVLTNSADAPAIWRGSNATPATWSTARRSDYRQKSRNSFPRCRPLAGAHAVGNITDEIVATPFQRGDPWGWRPDAPVLQWVLPRLAQHSTCSHIWEPRTAPSGSGLWANRRRLPSNEPPSGDDTSRTEVGLLHIGSSGESRKDRLNRLWTKDSVY